MTDNIKSGLMRILRAAGYIMLSAHGGENDYGIKSKPGNANFVTEYDVAVQNYVISEVKKLIPECTFIAEEKDNDASALKSKVCFILDPIDGTTNFIRDLGQSSISLAMLCDGKPELGFVYFPWRDEMFFAEKGRGAFLNGAPIKVSGRALPDAVVSFGTAPYYTEYADKTFELCRSLFKSCADVRRAGSAAIDLANLAAGRTDIFFEYRLSPWDYAAGMLLIKEAGGVITDMDGNELSFSEPCSVIASNKGIYSTLLKAVKTPSF